MKVMLCSSKEWFGDGRVIEINTIEELMALVKQKGDPIIVAEPGWTGASDTLPNFVVYNDYIE